MKKYFIILTVLLLGIASSVQAAGVALTDAELDEIDAGFWVKYAPTQDVEAIEEVWHSTNDINLKDTSQTNIQAVNNVNAVDSAVAVQSNIAAVTVGSEAAINNVNQSNKADLLNYNPSLDNKTLNKTSTTTISEAAEASLKHSDLFDQTIQGKGSSSSTSLTDFFDATLATSEGFAKVIDTGDGEIVAAGASLVYFDVDDIESNGSSTSDYHQGNHTIADKITEGSSSGTGTTTIESTENQTMDRSNFSENNHLDLKDTSQKLLQVVSNLNAVGSSAAVQTNIASNVGMTGAITQMNTATAINGL